MYSRFNVFIIILSSPAAFPFFNGRTHCNISCFTISEFNISLSSSKQKSSPKMSLLSVEFSVSKINEIFKKATC